MMNKKHTSRLVGWTKNLLLIPIVGVAMLAFTNPDKTKKNTGTVSPVETTNDVRNFIARSIKYPLAARDAGVETTVSANFNIDKNGKVNNVKVGGNPTAIQLDKVVVVAYAGEAGTAKQGSKVPETAKSALENEVIRVVEKLPVIKDKVLVGKNVQMDFEFVLQNREDEVQANSVAPSLYVVDGEEVSRELVERIDVEDITQVNVLKNQAAVDKYGERAKDGVIEITTKSNTDAVQLFKSTDKVQISSMDVKVTADNGETPLFVVDGKKQERGEVDERNIESVSVLNGQAAEDVFGEEGKNGVVIINTKKGSVESGNVTISAERLDVKSDNADEVVVMGYGSMKKGNSSSIDNIMVRQGEKAEAVRIKVRSGNEQPYIILDGEDYTGSLDDLDPDKIESISVLKDHSAETLYGDKAKNGVIIINSKK